MARGLMVMGLCVVLGTGCGSSSEDDDDTGLSGDPLDCAWLASNNCWKTTVAAAAGCVPPEAETGVLSADGSSCTYASGPSVAFHDPVVLPLPFDGPPVEWNFTQSQGGAACVTFQDVDGESQVLTVQGMTFREDIVGFGIQVTCPDGSQYAADDAFELLDCTNFFEGAPGHAWTDTDTSVAFSLINGTNGAVPVFSCAR